MSSYITIAVTITVKVNVRGGYGDFGTKRARMFVSTISMYIAYNYNGMVLSLS
jgi:hypothetical protein